MAPFPRGGSETRWALPATFPAGRAASVMCDRDDPDFVRRRVLEDAVGKPAKNIAASCTSPIASGTMSSFTSVQHVPAPKPPQWEQPEPHRFGGERGAAAVSKANPVRTSLRLLQMQRCKEAVLQNPLEKTNAASHEECVYDPCARFIPIRRLRAAERRSAGTLKPTARVLSES